VISKVLANARNEMHYPPEEPTTTLYNKTPVTVINKLNLVAKVRLQKIADSGLPTGALNNLRIAPRT
jgi:hypothetical protein